MNSTGFETCLLNMLYGKLYWGRDLLLPQDNQCVICQIT